MHVHVAHPDGEAKLWLDPGVELATQAGLAKHVIGEAQQPVEDPDRRSSMPGTSTFPVEVTNVSRHGLWLLVGDEELFLPFEHFPWFRDASIEKISVVEREPADQLYWPLLDIDLTVESIRTPDAFPLVARGRQ